MTVTRTDEDVHQALATLFVAVSTAASQLPTGPAARAHAALTGLLLTAACGILGASPAEVIRRSVVIRNGFASALENTQEQEPSAK